MEYRQAFVAVRKDPRWKRKIAICAVVSLIPYLGVIWLMGWQMQYQRNVAWGHDERLPEWSDVSGQALLGLKSFVAQLPYSFVLGAVLSAMYFALFAVTGLYSTVDTAPIWMVFMPAAVTVIVTTAFMMLTLPLTSSVSLRVALFGTFESGFQLKEIWRLMHAHRPELLRAWGFAVTNMLIVLAFNAVCLGLLVAAFAFAAINFKDNVLPALGIVIGGYALYFPLQVTLAAYVGAATSHYFGSYGRIAYALGTAAETA